MTEASKSYPKMTVKALRKSVIKRYIEFQEKIDKGQLQLPFNL